MPDSDIHKDRDKATVPDSLPAPSTPTCMTLEGIIDFTEELEHLNELIMLHLEKCGGFTSPASYFTEVQPILDLLEVELRVRCASGMTQKQVKLIIQDWIDEEIASIRKKQ